MADYKIVVPKIQAWEGGFSNNPNDAGGATMKGVTLATFRKFYGEDRTVEDLKRISEKQWRHIFKQGYWDKVKADDIKDQSVADLLVDWVWMSGVTTPAKTVQRLVGATQDGLIGPRTIAAINAADGYTLFTRLHEARRQFYYDIVERRPANQVFLKGWLNRLNAYKYV